MNELYFFDSYAMIEIIRGSANYAKFRDSFIVMSKLNIFEVFYALLRDKGEEIARHFLRDFYQFAIDFSPEVIEEAAKFRLARKRQNISMADAIGYVLAKSLGIRFLTGDEQFRNIEDVEFVK
jgi:predicted nucleic acid-binding protein